MAKKHRDYRARLKALGIVQIGVNVPVTVERELKEALGEIVDAIRSGRMALEAAPSALAAALQSRFAVEPMAEPAGTVQETTPSDAAVTTEVAPTKLVRFKYPPKGAAGAEWDRLKRQFGLEYYRYDGRDYYWALDGLTRSDQDMLLEAAHATGNIDDVVTFNGPGATAPAR